MSDTKKLCDAPRDLESIKAQEKSLALSQFTSEDAFQLGVHLRTRIRSLFPKTPAVISITSANCDHLLFHCTTQSDTTPDNDVWVSRKRKTVKRFGVSSWFMGCKFEGDEARFAAKNALGVDAGSYAIHGGAVPVRVRGVEGIVAVVVVSGLKQHEDHMVVVEGLEELKKGLDGKEKELIGGVVENENVGNAKLGNAVPSTRETKAMVDELKADGAVLAS